MRDLRAFWNPVLIGPGRSHEGLKYGGFLRLFFGFFDYTHFSRKARVNGDYVSISGCF